ncbi:BppU family phage baseplate upper protein [Lactobacillus johnsonii]|uniref:BppU family phage baseplate upper protein n=1 Tax=Lactobacillus johnsonii TaxID=33959 RepID=UPI0022E3568B|nr:BppU family phage baseplate upper protein [Lactobacillus johnsonii]
MDAVTISLTLDLSKRNSTLNEITRLRQTENNSTTLKATVLDHNKEIDLSQCSAELHFKKPNGEICVQAAQIEDNDVVCTLSNESTAISGNAEAYFQICNKDKTIVNTTDTFYLQILPGLMPVNKIENELQPIDLHTLSNNNERKAEWI